MNLYFEYPDVCIGRRFSITGRTIPAKHCVRFNQLADTIPFGLMFSANRIWQEDENGVKFVKHRDDNPTETPVDLKEFLWVKLSATTV